MTQTIPHTNYCELLLFLAGKRIRFQIAGDSMRPLLKPGEEILINPQAYRHSMPNVNDVVVIIHPQKPQLLVVKRVTAVMKNGDCFLLGDNSQASTDSRHWGTVASTNLIGKVSSIFV